MNLIELSSIIQSKAGDLKMRGELRPETGLFLHTKFLEWSYGEKGLGNRTRHSSVVAKDVWGGASILTALESSRAEIEQAVATLAAAGFDRSKVEIAVVQMCTQIVQEILDERTIGTNEAAHRIASVNISLAGDEVRAWVCADIAGVAVLTPPLEFEENGRRILLRAIERSDFENDVPLELESYHINRMALNPSAVLLVEYQAVDSAHWQRELERAAAVLQLFGVGEVRWSHVEGGSDSLLDSRAPYACVDLGGGKARTYTMYPSDSGRLPHFWRTVSQALPEHFYWQGPEDPEGLHGAYDNYRRAVAGFGYANAKVAAVVRSLESLFLGGRSKDISAKLQSRASALLCACGFDEGEVRNNLRLAYGIRSRFVHGERPRKLNNAEDIISLCHRCLEYNRAALVASLVSNLEKDELIRAIGSPARLQRIGAAFRDAERRDHDGSG